MPSWRKVATIFTLMLVTTCYGVYAALKDKPVYEYHDVKVIGVIDHYTWNLAKSDGPFQARFCHDYDMSKITPIPGNVMWKLRYEDYGDCISIRRDDLGFWWMRDSQTGRATKEN